MKARLEHFGLHRKSLNLKASRQKIGQRFESVLSTTTTKIENIAEGVSMGYFKVQQKSFTPISRDI
jgi:ribosomal protein L6P/L9E